ncbi:SHOCT domain-containing protein [Streptomyces sp. RB6PN25]|uniref:SHOCT domain-containing protein n=1 Tax=Streptomyces humicola TaxID=2953240 RepID=A0ABT1PVK7_9ACTN|nr:SHOCT domain-containing protein [Streptomyces humicola]MCQ4081704.1 SHOCT domain-containing protein [Streptomyces humicola]
MMFWYGHGMSGWGWFTMSIGTVAFWALIITVVALLFRALAPTGNDGIDRTPPPDWRTPEQLLAERFASGEIDEDEYRRRLDVLRGSASHTTPTTPTTPT